MTSCRLLDLPDELLTKILLHTTTPSFVQVTVTCHRIFDLAADSRDVVLRHLRALPGIKLGLDDLTVRTQDLFLLFRQRASKHLYGAYFTADCVELRYRNVSIDSDASCMAELGADYITVSMALKDSLTVRLYGSKCALKEKIESPYCGGVGKILQVVHRKHTISVLYQWHRFRSPLPEFDKPLVPKTVAEKMACTTGPSLIPEDTVDDKPPPLKMKYHLLHYNAYTLDRPYFFSIEPYKDLVPAHLTVNSRLHCAILWDKKDYKMEPSDSAEIVLYTANKCPVNEEGAYETRVIWPTTHEIRPTAPTIDEIVSGKAPSRPKRIAFYKEGRRLKMFDAGGVIPYSVISAGASYDSRAGSNQVAFETGTVFRVDTPFFGIHETYTDDVEEQNYCNLSHLCLAVAELGSSSSTSKMLCILRSKTKYEHDDCGHTVNLSRMAHVSAHNCKAVARLWGWSEACTTQTGLETVSISKFGTRIAISMWDKVYVWALDPKMLCEDINDVESEEEDKKTQKAKKKRKAKAKGVADDFYMRVKDPNLGWRIAELKPIVLDLKGAVARQMTWSLIDEEEEQSESDAESDVGEPETQQEATDTQTETVPEIDQICAEPPIELPLAAKEQQVTVDPDPVTVQNDQETELEPQAVPAIQSLDVVKETLASPPLVEENTRRFSTDKTPKEAELALTKSPTERLAHPTTDYLRGRHITIEEKQPEIETQIISPTPSPISIIVPIASQPPPKQPVTAIVVEAPSLPPTLDLQPPQSPKGKEKEHETLPSLEPLPTPSSSCAFIPTTAPISSTDPPPNQGDTKNDSSDNSSESNQPKPKAKKHRKRHTEDELVIMTDRGIQVWDLGPWGKGKRTREWLSER